MSSWGDRSLVELVVTDELDRTLATVDADLVQRLGLRPADVPDRLALLVSRIVARVVETLDEGSRPRDGAAIVRELVAQLHAAAPKAGVADLAPVAAAEVLRAVLTRRPDGKPEPIAAPLIPLLDTTLLTNAPGEPTVGHQIATEIDSSDRIDVLMAFIRRSGIRPFEDALGTHSRRGRPLRVLTTTYTGSTERAALDALARLGAHVRVSYDTTTTRLHAKSWLFHRDARLSGVDFSTAYIGSSNLTHSAQRTGLEWNVRVSGARNPDVLAKMAAVFDAYWESGDFLDYDPDEYDRAVAVDSALGITLTLSPVEITLRPFQERLLERIEVARAAGRHRNLLVAATGTGKTVMAAVDYARLRPTLASDRLLFVAHREELLTQALATYRHALRDGAFGELWVGGRRPTRFDHVFASIQALAANGLADLDPDHFDVVVVDEFHHAAAPTYRRLLDRVQPRELLGLTATPERSDGLPVLDWFDDRIAAELRLWDAVDQHYLTPFAYYGIADGVDLTQVPWQRGRGYDIEALTSVYTSDHAWARQVLRELVDHVGDLRSVRVLGFCVSVAHARFMAQRFRDAGVAAVAVTGETSPVERAAALDDLAAGRIQVVFSVDLFNEGVDVPAVDTLLLLRPTDSPVLFLQQLGRGLRRAPGKSVCTVLDFVANHRREFRFDRIYRALFAGTRAELQRTVRDGFPFLPSGCSFQLDPVARERVLDSIRSALPSRWPDKVAELRSVAAAVGEDVSLGRFLAESGLELDDVYDGKRTWTDLRVAAGLPVAAPGPHDEALLRAVGRLTHVDDVVRLRGYRDLLDVAPEEVAGLPERERRLARMLIATLGDQVLERGATLTEGRRLLRDHPRAAAELRELLDALAGDLDHLHLAVADDVPLQVHARYSRIEILAGLGAGERSAARTPQWREGVKWIEEARTDAFVVTLDKTGGGFSPTTRYRDYAISRELFHWESQSTTSADSRTGQRYQHHREQGSQVLLFARVRDIDPAFWFLGPCEYVQHRGSRPMAVTWRLRHRMPADLFQEFSAAVA